jgi:hypothetical protein
LSPVSCLSSRLESIILAHPGALAGRGSEQHHEPAERRGLPIELRDDPADPPQAMNYQCKAK